MQNKKLEISQVKLWRLCIDNQSSLFLENSKIGENGKNAALKTKNESSFGRISSFSCAWHQPRVFEFWLAYTFLALFVFCDWSNMSLDFTFNTDSGEERKPFQFYLVHPITIKKTALPPKANTHVWNFPILKYWPIEYIPKTRVCNTRHITT